MAYRESSFDSESRRRSGPQLPATSDDEHGVDRSYEDTELGHDPAKVEIFKDLQKLRGAQLVVPVGEEHMYFAAMNSRSCRLTALGFQYWRLASEKKL